MIPRPAGIPAFDRTPDDLECKLGYEAEPAFDLLACPFGLLQFGQGRGHIEMVIE